jgi:hypothetical protein
MRDVFTRFCSRLDGHRLWPVLGLLGAIALAGCSGRSSLLDTPFRPVYAPLPPAFLIGSIGEILATNAPFEARVEELGAAPNPDARLTGKLFGNGKMLAFAADPSAETHSDSPEEIFTYLWDPASHQGHILNDALQAYAPVTVTQPAETAAITVKRTDPATQFPLEITAQQNARTITVRLTRIRVRPQPDELFTPPRAFSVYPSPEILAREIALRRHNFR